MIEVAILGCGPAGLLAAHATAINGNVPIIYSDKAEPSRIGGAQFLHRWIPNITDKLPDDLTEFIFQGTAAGYAKKVYGNERAETSWGTYHPGLHPTWNMQKAYERLWEMYEGSIVVEKIDNNSVYELEEQIVLSCIPAYLLCDHFRDPIEPDGAYRTCDFFSQDVWISEDVPNTSENRIVYNGFEGNQWYRWSSLFGYSFFEFPHEPKERKSVRVSKPLSTTCPGPSRSGVYRLGRYGSFQKKALIHDAFEGALYAMHNV